MRFLFSLLYVFCLSSLFLFRSTDATNYTTPIKHVVVLMLENRSFDHVLGQLHKINPAIDGLKGTEKQSTNTSEPSAPVYPVHKGAKWVTPDPDHGYDANMMQLFGDPCKVIDPAPMSGFLENGLVRFNKNLTSALGAISSFDVDEIPVYTTLINEFALMQKYYCSAPTSTWPNRLYIHSSTSDGETSTSDYLRMILGFPQKTIYDLLDENGVSWNSFFNELPDQLLFQSGRSIENLGKLRPYFEFAGMVKEGKLPAFSWISPKYFDIPCIPADDQHPPHDFSLGEQRVKEVYELLRASPSWNETLFIVTYDENGGFFDHVPTPQKDIPNPDGKTAPNGFNFDRLGARVPTLLISPWIEKGTLIDEPSGEQIQAQGSQFDHTSIIATVRKLFNITTPLTHRDAWAATFDNLFKVRDTPRTDCPETLPLPSIPSNYHSTGGDELSDLQREVIKIAAGAAGVNHDDLLRGMNKWRTELDGASWVIKTVYQQILKRDIPKSLQAALQLGPGHALSQCAEVHQLMNEEKEQTTAATL